MSRSPFFLTTPIYYVNGTPHVGSAYTTVAADVTARFERLRGREVFFLTGTDENATKVLDKAREEGMSPEAYLESLIPSWVEAWRALHISYDDFIRTTEERHRHAVREFFSLLTRSGDIYLGNYEGWYCVACETFWRESDAPDQLCPNAWCRRLLTKMKEETYFFRLSNYQDAILKWIEEKPDRLLPEFRRNEVVAFIKQGLRDQSISRPGEEWGIPTPDDPHQTVYVWFDALINYLTAAGWPNDRARFEGLWPPDVQFMAKDIFVRFHCTLWPAMLMAAGLPLPERLIGHGFWTSAGQKISKSLGNAIDPGELARSLAEKSGCDVDVAADALRYHLLRETPFGQDGDFTVSALEERFNTDLANDLGNLCNRIVSICGRLFGGKVPPLPPGESPVRDAVQRAHATMTAEFENQRYSLALQALTEAIRDVNRHLNDRAPWNLHKLGDADAAAGVVAEVIEATRSLALLVSPVMPCAAERLLSQLGDPATEESRVWDDAISWIGRAEGKTLAAPAPVFPRIETQARAKSATPPRKSTQDDRKANPMSEVASPAAADGLIGIEEFGRVKLRTARVLAAEKVEGSDKLLRLDVEMGDEDRTVVAGIAESYSPEQLVGKTVVVVANLKPAKLRGVVSQGMLLAATGPNGPILVTPETAIPSGSEVR